MKSLLPTIFFAWFVSAAIAQYTITNFNKDNSGLPNNYIFSVKFDGDNTAWIGAYEYQNQNTYGGLVKYDHSDWTVLRMDMPPYNAYINNVTHATFGPDGNMWVVTHHSGGDIVTRWNGNSYTNVTPTGAGFLRDGILVGNSIWFTSPWCGLFEYNYGTQEWFKHANFPLSAPDYPITTMNVDQEGRFWVGIQNRNLYIFKDTIISKITLFEEFPPESKEFHAIQAIEFADDHSAWLGTSEGLVHWVDESNYVLYTIENSALPSHDITSLEIDDHGNVWVGTSNQGVVVWTGSEFIQFHSTNSEIRSNFVRDVEQDREGNIWIATWGGGVSRFTLEPNAIQDISYQANRLLVSPNPVKRNGPISFSTGSETPIVSFELLSLDGKNLQSVIHTPDEHGSVSCLDVSPGLYLYRATDSHHLQYIAKILVVD